MRTTIQTPIAVRDLPMNIRQGLALEERQLVQITLETVGNSLVDHLHESTSIEQRNHIFDVLEGHAGKESSDEWIESIKSSRTTSPLKAVF